MSGSNSQIEFSQPRPGSSDVNVSVSHLKEVCFFFQKLFSACYKYKTEKSPRFVSCAEWQRCLHCSMHNFLSSEVCKVEVKFSFLKNTSQHDGPAVRLSTWKTEFLFLSRVYIQPHAFLLMGNEDSEGSQHLRTAFMITRWGRSAYILIFVHV